MKKLIAITLTLLLILTLLVPVSAVTTMRWDWGKAQASIGNAAVQIVQEAEPATEPFETVYMVEETAETLHMESEPEPVAETTVEREQSWRDWFRSWGNWIRYERE